MIRLGRVGYCRGSFYRIDLDFDWNGQAFRLEKDFEEKTERLINVISGEEIVTPAHGSREMPIWGPIFGQIAWDQDLGKVRIYNLTRYIESLQKK